MSDQTPTFEKIVEGVYRDHDTTTVPWEKARLWYTGEIKTIVEAHQTALQKAEQAALAKSSLVAVDKELTRHADKIGLWGMAGMLLDEKAMAGILTYDERSERDAMVTERRAIQLVMGLLKQCEAQLTDTNNKEIK